MKRKNMKPCAFQTEDDCVDMPFCAFCENLFRVFQKETIFKPDVAILIELYEDELNGRLTTVSNGGLRYDIKPTTTLRYLKELEEKGWVIRSKFSDDKRISFVRIAPELKKSLDQVVNIGKFTSSASYTPAS